MCGKNIPLARDVYALDPEWERRYPAMRGTLACSKCALSTSWSCTTRDGQFVDGHIPATQGSDFDAWSHILGHGTHRAMVLSYPHSGLLQGAEGYLRTFAERWNSRLAARVLAALGTPVSSLARSDGAVSAS
ncbi:hypothetical protein ACN6LC_004643 [Streptomyces violaceoruber]|uniref:hypothetical protein n=1 Tax=Streptomyces violaceoruber TaxID=1935 RepID=UPI00403CBD47